MIRRPPRSTLFPTRRSSDLDAGERAGERCWPLPLWEEYRELLKSDVADVRNSGGRSAGTIAGAWFLRSEEHTSELQSPCNLVCRLLLEKKQRRRVGRRSRLP